MSFEKLNTDLEDEVRSLQKGAEDCSGEFRGDFSSLATKALELRERDLISDEQYRNYAGKIDEAVQDFSRDCDCGL
jgi:hypothetical protein